MSPKTTETLTDILEELAESGVTDEQIGDAVGKCAMAVTHWRARRSVPSCKSWHLLAKLSGRTIEDIACAIARGVKPVPARGLAATGAVRSRR